MENLKKGKTAKNKKKTLKLPSKKEKIDLFLVSLLGKNSHT